MSVFFGLYCVPALVTRVGDSLGWGSGVGCEDLVLEDSEVTSVSVMVTKYGRGGDYCTVPGRVEWCTAR